MKHQIKEEAAAGSVAAGNVATHPSPLGTVKRRSLKNFMIDYSKKFTNTLKLKVVGLYKVSKTNEGHLHVVASSTPITEKFNLDSVFAQLKGFENANSVEPSEVTTYGVEDDKGNLMKVTVLNTQAEDFEAYISAYLSTLKDFDNQGIDLEEISLAELLYKLKDLFDIRDVEFPNIPDDIVYNADEASDNVVEPSLETDLDPSLDMPEDDMGMEGEGELGGEDELDLDVDADLDLDAEEGDLDMEDEFADDESVEDFEEMPEEGGIQSLLTSLIDMLAKTAEKEKAQAEAEAEKARAEQAEWSAKAVDATLANKEELIAMQAQKDEQKRREKEAKKQADLATYRYKQSKGMVDEPNPTFEGFDGDSLLLGALISEAFSKKQIKVHNLKGHDGGFVYDETQTNDEIGDGDIILTDWGPVIFVSPHPVNVFKPAEDDIDAQLMGYLKQGYDWNTLHDGKYRASYELAKKYTNKSLNEEETVDDPIMLRRIFNAEMQALRKEMTETDDQQVRASLQKRMSLLQRKFAVKKQEAEARRQEEEARAAAEDSEESMRMDQRQQPGMSSGMGMTEEYVIEEITEDEYNLLEEGAKRQFKRYGNKFVRKFRCYGGPKSGRMVSKMSDCGMRKDPFKVRQGKRASRMKKGQRIRKTKLAKKKSPSLRLVRMNKNLRGKR